MNAGERFAVRAVFAMLLVAVGIAFIVALAVSFVREARADGVGSVGSVGTVGAFNVTADGAPGNIPTPPDGIVTEAGQSLQTEADVDLIEE